MKLPLGIQTFSEIRNEGYVYVDKTEHIHRIVTTGKYLFLSRPRRFGKSLLLSTMRALFEGQKELFEGLWIEDQWDWNKSHPVIHVKFSSFKYKEQSLPKAIETGLDEEATRLGVELQKGDYYHPLKELIEEAYKKYQQRVVLLIDEYDKPIIDYLDHLNQAAINRDHLKTFYSVIKDSDPYLEFVFLTGVSRFSKTSIFSELNNLTNLTLDFQAADLLGLTEKEIRHYFDKKLQEIADHKQIELEELMEEMRRWYNGYSWNGKTKVYNPFSLLSFLRSEEFENYWFETGTPTFLVKKMKDTRFFKIEPMKASDSVLNSYDLENLNPLTILFQTGYVTILEKYRQGIYIIDYPNQEVKASLEERLLNAYAYDEYGAGKVRALELVEALEEGNVELFIRIINSAFASIPASLWQKENEAFYHALIHLLCSLMGVFIQSEINSSNGRLDAKVETPDSIYILEFKLGKSAEEAVNQIGEKGYFKPYMDSKKKRIGVGINFSIEKKEVEEWAEKVF